MFGTLTDDLRWNPPMNFLRKAMIRYKADRILKRMGITHPPVCPQTIAEALYFRVLFVDFRGDDMNDVLGFYDPADKTIYVSKASTPREMQITIATELGKALLFPKWCADAAEYRILKRSGERKREEFESGWFATCLLVPRRWIVDLQRYAAMKELETVFVADRAQIMRSLARANGD